MKKLKWMMFRLGEAVGVPGLTALAFALFGLLYMPAMLWPAQQRLEMLGKIAARPHGDILPASAAESPAHAFLSSFPPADDLAGELRKMFDIAQERNFDLGEVSYKSERKQGEHLERYHVDFSLDAPYPDIRSFLSELLVALPYVSLDQLSFDRDSVQSETVRANVRLTMHLVH
jgi:hypothetical protein